MLTWEKFGETTEGETGMNVRLACLIGICGAALQTSPAAAQAEISMATSWGGGPHIEVMAKTFAARAQELTDGEVVITVYPGGTLGSPLKVTETVQQGVAQAGHHWSGYDWGVDKTAVLFGGYAGSMPAVHYIHWLFEGGGAELWKDWRMQEFGVVGFPCGSHADEIFMHSRKKIETLDDFKGTKVRTSGAWAEIATRLGASTVILPGPEVYPALERGVVDAIEWASPAINYSLGFHKIAPYIIMPGVHQASSAQECIFNKDVWDGFTPRQQQMIELAGKLSLLEVWLYFNNADVEALQKLRDEGAEFVVVDDAFIEAARNETRKWEDETAAAEGGWFAKVLESQRNFMQQWAAAPLYRTELKDVTAD
jgi:TRAP-type mannitol/chloroaromatic compound transport system substrate-binding protein